MSVERIYIGGLDPPRLSGKDIVGRLKSLDIDVKSIEDKEKCFIHLTATSLGDQSALSIISQKYNNVKWKGCRLGVAEAKPHFLQRLEMERQERAARNAQEKEQEEQTGGSEELQAVNEKEEMPSRIPRRLRIRKKFGDEAFHVDTRPFSVDSWKNFHAAKRKLRKRAENHAQKAMKIKEMKNTAYTHAPLEHRAVHIRFTSSGDREAVTTPAVSSSDEHEASELSKDDESEASVSSSDEESLSDEESSSVKEAKAMKIGGSYDWSDDSDKDTSDDEMSTKNNITQEENNMAKPIAPQQSVVVENFEEAKAPAPQNEYQWSSDSSSDESSVSIKRTRTFQEVAVDDEFAAGLDDEKWNSSDEEDYVPANEKNSKDAAYQMDNDVSTNLGVLAELFPDMKDKSPLNPLDEDEDAKLQESSKSTTKSSMPFGIMPRYDPTAATSQKFEVKEEERKEEESEVSEESEEEVEMKGGEQSGSDDESKSEDDGDHDEIEAGNDSDKKPGDNEGDKGHIYEEGKLENVFREARDAWQVQSTQTIQKKEEPSTTGAFSFGFDLGTPEPKTEAKNDGGFSFGFDLPPSKSSDGNTDDQKEGKNSEKVDETANDKMHEEENDEEDPEPNMKRRRGLRFSQGEMQSYEADFFAHNYGEQIMDDLEGFRNDQDERELWLRERQSLTLDWKRKRKLAMSRIQKRVRHR